MPIPEGQLAQNIVSSGIDAVVTNALYSPKAENAFNSAKNKLNTSIFGSQNSPFSFDVSVESPNLMSIHDVNIDRASQAGTLANNINNIYGLYDQSSWEVSANYQPKNSNVTFQALANINGSVGAGVKFNNGNRITANYSIPDGNAELAYSTNSPILQTKTGVYYDKARQTAGVAGSFGKQISHNVSLSGNANVNFKGDWSSSISADIKTNSKNNVKLGLGVASDNGVKSGFLGATITF